MMDRRHFLSTLFSLPAVAATRPAFAEWAQGFDTSSARTGQRDDAAPLLGNATLEATRQAAARYRNLAQQGGWPAIRWTQRLSLGAKHPEVDPLRHRLTLTNDLDPRYARGMVYDSFVDAAVRGFQARHGLVADGVAGPSTFEALNEAAAIKADRLAANIDRIADGLASERRYVSVNVPSAEIEMVEDQSVVLRQLAIVGQPDRATPLLSSAIYEVNFNPYWTVPKSIIRKDLIPIIRDDPEYLDRMGMRILDSDWKEVSPDTIDWSGEEAAGYTFRQDPGVENALGRVRINFANNFAVYMHDTPQPGLFGDDSRFFSSGCVRVQRIPEFITWLLKETEGWDEAAVSEALRNGERKDVTIGRPVPVHFVYITAWGTADGSAEFRDDIYNLMSQS